MDTQQHALFTRAAVLVAGTILGLSTAAASSLQDCPLDGTCRGPGGSAAVEADGRGERRYDPADFAGHPGARRPRQANAAGPDARPTRSATEVPACDMIDPGDPLHARVDRSTSLSRDFEPPDLALVPLEQRNRYAAPIWLRELVHGPLLQMVEAMNSLGLWPTVVSGYRSYSDQALAYQKWGDFDPLRARQISARPGHSEHQLGTVVDFSTPGMQYGFGTRFAATPEGIWLNHHASAFGFVLSYPEWAAAQTGYEWEPWHYRYVGLPLSKALRAQRLTLTSLLARCALPQELYDLLR